MKSMRFSLSQLECLVAVCEAQSITTAATELHLSPSTVSTTISSLERRLGVDLLIRHHARGVTPTPAGLRLLMEARTLLRHAAQVDRLAGDLEGRVTGEVDVGCLVTVAPIVMPVLWTSFEDEYPGVRVRLHEGDHDGLLALLRSGAIATALTYPLHIPHDMTFDPLLTLDPVALVASEHPFATRDSVTLEELAVESLILIDLPFSREYFLSLFAHLGLTPQVRHRSRNLELIYGLVANGFGYTIIAAQPAVDRALDGRRFVTVPIEGDPAPSRLGLLALKANRHPGAVVAFHDFCKLGAARQGLGGLHVGTPTVDLARP